MKQFNIKNIIIFSLFVFNVQNIFSQTIIKGTVKDSVNVLEQAHIVAFDTANNSISTYAITDNNGNFQLKLKHNKYYELRISYLGYKTAIIPIPTEKLDLIVKNIVLKADNTLDDVNITYTMPIKINGDTITYDADSFSTGNEKKLQDVLENLPGVDISETGKIKVEGKEVSKIMVDGKEFFSGDTKLASQNIPANVVDKVQVLNNYNEIGMMKGVNADNDNPAINIKLKQGKKRFWFGDIESGGGYQVKYIFNPKLFYYSPKTSVNFIGDINNIGKQSLTFQDYIRFSGGIASLLEENNGAVTLNSDDLGFLFLPKNTAKQIKSEFAALNINHNYSKKLSISGFAIFNTNSIEMLKQNDKEYFINMDDETINSNSDISNRFVLYKIGFNYQPSRKLFFDYSIFGKYNNGGFNNILSSNIYGNVNSKKDNQKNDIKQRIRMYYSLCENSILSLNLYHKYFDNNLSVNFNPNNQVYPFLPFNDNVNLDFRQFKRFTGNDFKAKIEYIYLFNKQNNMKFSFGNQYSDNRLLLNTKQFISNNEIAFSENTILGNNLNRNIQYYYSKINYKTLIGRLTAMIGAKFHYITSNNKQEELNYNNEKTEITPNIFLMYQLLKTRSLSFRYNVLPEFVDSKKLSEAYFFNDYNNLVFGSRQLNSALNHNFTLNYMDFNSFSFSNTQISINYSIILNPISNLSEYIDENFITRYEQINNSNESLSSNINYEKRIKKYKIKVGSEVFWTKYKSTINNEIIDNKSFMHSYKLSVSTYFKNAPNFEIGSKFGFNNYYQNKNKSNYTNYKTFANIEIPFLKQFIFTSDYSYNLNKNLQNDGKDFYSFLNADLYYKTKNNAWEFSISAKNILNTKLLRKISETDLYIYTSDYYVMQRSILLFVIYKL